MIYLIGGAPRCGKSTLADFLSRKTSYEVISADSIETEVKNTKNKFLHPFLFPKDRLREKTKGSNDLMYSKYTTEKITKAYIKQAKSSRKILSKLIKEKSFDNEDLIIEGHQIHPDLIKNLNLDPEKYKAIFLGKINKELIIDGFSKNIQKPDWVIDKTSDEKIFEKIAKFISFYSSWFKSETEKCNLKFYDVSEKFDDSLKGIAQKLLT